MLTLHIDFKFFMVQGLKLLGEWNPWELLSCAIKGEYYNSTAEYKILGKN